LESAIVALSAIPTTHAGQLFVVSGCMAAEFHYGDSSATMLPILLGPPGFWRQAPSAKRTISFLSCMGLDIIESRLSVQAIIGV